IGLGLCGVAVIGPRLRRQSLPEWVPDAPRLTIAVANVFVGNPTPQRTAAELVHSGVEVIVVNEVTDRFLECIDELGGDVWFPHRIIDHDGHPEYTTAVFSRRAFGAGSGLVVAPASLRVIRAHFDLDGTPLTLLATHLEANIERGAHPRWRAQVASLAALGAQAPSRTIIAGDLNSSIDRPSLDDLLERGYTDAHVSLGLGLDPSLKLAPRGPLAAMGAVARVDHLLMGGDVRAVEISRLRAPGSDHLPFAATIAVRRAVTDGSADQPGTWNTSAPPV
ncbi:MAG TPA: endonuclease/exonuclease/phosphatase family protein, partial [Acidimicrobiia bacterium]